MIEDAELLRQYSEHRSEEAFAELVHRRIDLVYSVAVRQVGGDVHLAQDVTQRVFVDLARKAKELSGRAVLSGWLYLSARFAATDVVRTERRRRARELEAQIMNETVSPAEQPVDWEKLRPMLDQVMSEMTDHDRDAVALRFFEERSFAEIGAVFRLTEDAARKRVDRALDKLHALLARRGVSSTTAALAVVLANQGVVAAPAALASAVTSAALAGVGTGGMGMLATFMTMTKLQVGIATALAVAGTIGLALQAKSNGELRQELVSTQAQTRGMLDLQKENLRLAKAVVEVRELRQDDGELARLRTEAVDLKDRLEKIERHAQAEAAKTPVPSRVEISQMDHAPRVKAPVNPVYPAEMKQAGIGGEVLVDFVVDANGIVRNAIASRSTRREFEAAALEAVRQWEFEPGARNGRQVNTRMQIPITFDPAAAEGEPRSAQVFDESEKKPAVGE